METIMELHTLRYAALLRMQSSIMGICLISHQWLLQVLLKPGERVLPGLGSLGFIITLAGVVMEGMIDPRVDLHLVGHPGLSQGLIHSVLTPCNPLVQFCVDAKDRSLDVGDLGHVRRRAIKRYGSFELR